MVWRRRNNETDKNKHCDYTPQSMAPLHVTSDFAGNQKTADINVIINKSENGYENIKLASNKISPLVRAFFLRILSICELLEDAWFCSVALALTINARNK